MHWRSLTHACLPFYADLVRNPKILDVVEDLIGPDILVWTSTFFIKEANSPTFAAWHQDSTYFGLDPYEQVTAWVALTDASQDAGCIEVLSAHGNPRQMRHVPKKLANSINRTGQTITEPLDDRGVSAMPLEAGQFSLHHTLCVHRSAPNHTPQRRIGLGNNYIPAHVRTTGSKRMPAMLVRGSDRYGHFDLYEPPVQELGEKELATHDHVYTCYAENYREQMKRHEQEFA
jgi:ectoine hydroxylase-related dioxygenase (phytanoyl-CoA dioxygenase family)